MEPAFNITRFVIELIVDYEGTKKKIDMIKKIPEIIDAVKNDGKKSSQ